MNCYKVLLSAAFLTAAYPALPQDSTAAHAGPPRKNITLPLFSYAPETSVALGGMLIHILTPDTLTTLSQVSVSALYTFDNQFLIQSNMQAYTCKNRYLIKSNLNFNKFPTYNYGVGNQTPDSNKTLIDYHVFKLDAAILKRMAPYTYAGVKAVYSRYYDVAKSNHTPLPDSLTGSKGDITAGLGITVVFDSRDNPLSAYRGWYAEVSAIANQPFLGSGYRYTSVDVDLRKFIKLPYLRKNVRRPYERTLALQVVSSVKSGTVPFLELSALGGSNIMRGYYTGRYLDKDLIAGQAEYRRMLSHTWGFALFAGVGAVGKDVNQLVNNSFHTSYGWGLRRVIGPRRRLNLRLDIGYGEGHAYTYLNLGEAF